MIKNRIILQKDDLPPRFTCPFCYTPHPVVVEAARGLIRHIDSTPFLKELFSEGKMLGVLLALDTAEGTVSCLYGFSGLVHGLSHIDGFVPPIFDTATVDLDSGSAEESRCLQNWLFDQYVVSNALGEKTTIREIFAARGLVPPGGTGDCAAPKLMQYAYSHGLKPLAMGEFWYGAAPLREIRRQGAFYPSCTGKCGPLLTYMMQGLEVEPNPLDSDNLWSIEEPVVKFEDEYIVVAEKPSGMLSVPGRNGRRSLQDWLSDYCHTPVYACHRLDMDTSGLMVFAKDTSTLASLQRQFEGRDVQKQYLARVAAPAEVSSSAALSSQDYAIRKLLTVGEKGMIKLPLASDYYDRPRQVVDYENGKMSVTAYEILRCFGDGTIEVLFTPLTGRTHQLRVHAAHPLGLGCPIIGDRLYGGELFPDEDCLNRHLLLNHLPQPNHHLLLNPHSQLNRHLFLNPHPSTTSGHLDCARSNNLPVRNGTDSNDSLAKTFGQTSRLMLHACKIVFRHPVTGSRMTFTSVVDFQQK